MSHLKSYILTYFSLLMGWARNCYTFLSLSNEGPGLGGEGEALERNLERVYCVICQLTRNNTG